MCTKAEEEISQVGTQLNALRREGAQAATLRAYKELCSRLDAICERDPHNYALKALSAELLAVGGKFGKARAMCETALATPGELGPSHSSLWYYTLGRVLYDEGELESAAEKLREALRQPCTPADAESVRISLYTIMSLPMSYGV